MARRERWSIVGSVLDALEAGGPSVRLSHVARHANIPHDRLMEYLESLAVRGLVTRERPPRLTSEGLEFLAEYRAWSRALQRFGIV